MAFISVPNVNCSNLIALEASIAGYDCLLENLDLSGRGLNHLNRR
jgi:hypothetical protein